MSTVLWFILQVCNLSKTWYYLLQPCALHGVLTTMHRQQKLSRRTLGKVRITFFKIIKSSPATRHEGAWEERKYSSYSLTNSVLDGGEWSASRPGRALPPGKGPPISILQEAEWAQSPFGHRDCRKYPLPLLGIEPLSPGSPARSETLHWLCYPAPSQDNILRKFLYNSFIS
jgi:hypothetical protein